MQRPPTAFPIHQEELTRQRPKTPKPLGGTEPDEIETILSFPISKPVTPLYMERKYEAGTYEVPSWQRELKDPNPERHELERIRQGTKVKEQNSIFEPHVDYVGDCKEIRAGQAVKEGDKFSINGRLYGHHHGFIYPIEGEGVHKFTESEFKAFSMFNQHGISPKTIQIVRRFNGVKENDIEKAKEKYHEFRNKYPELY